MARKKESGRKGHPVLPSVGERILHGLKELESSLRKGEKLTEKFTIRTVELDLEPQVYSGASVKAVREGLGVSQAVFAQLLGVSIHAVQAWEQDKRTAPKIARRLMDEIRDHPHRWVKLLRQSSKHESVA